MTPTAAKNRSALDALSLAALATGGLGLLFVALVHAGGRSLPSDPNVLAALLANLLALHLTIEGILLGSREIRPKAAWYFPAQTTRAARAGRRVVYALTSSLWFAWLPMVGLLTAGWTHGPAWVLLFLMLGVSFRLFGYALAVSIAHRSGAMRWTILAVAASFLPLLGAFLNGIGVGPNLTGPILSHLTAPWDRLLLHEHAGILRALLGTASALLFALVATVAAVIDED